MEMEIDIKVEQVREKNMNETRTHSRILTAERWTKKIDPTRIPRKNVQRRRR